MEQKTILEPVNNLLSLYEAIFDQQEKKDETSRSYGLWPSHIAMSNDAIPSLGIDHNILLGLQTMLMLLDIAAKYPLPQFEILQKRFDIALTSFILDTQKSGRVPGFIAFWPYIKYDQDVWKHNFDATNPVFKHMDIKNEIGDSTLAAIYLMKTGNHADYVLNYKNLISHKDYENGFYTFFPPLNHSGGIDLVDNINILSAIQLLQKIHPETTNKQLSTNKENAISRIQEIIKRNLIKPNMLYYRRISQFLLAFAKQKNDGLSPFKDEDYSMINDFLHKELQKYNSEESHDFAGNIELLLTCKLLYNSAKKMPLSIKKESDQLHEKFKDTLGSPIPNINRSALGEYTSFTAKSGFIDTIIYNQFVGWYSLTYIKAVTLFYFSLQKVGQQSAN